VRNTSGWQIHPALDELRSTQPIDKPTFGSTELGAMLQAANGYEPIRRVTLVGVCTDICVISNALLIKAFLPEAEIVVDASCCAGVTPESHQIALQAMQACQIQVIGQN
jgi:nicotinamidase-related amidase